MASFSLVHGAWGGGWLWDLLRTELEGRGHVVHAPDLPCEDATAGVEEYTAAVPAANVAVGYSLGGLTIPFVEAHTHVYLTALVAGTGWDEVFVPGFGDARVRDELGRSYYPDPADAVRELQIPDEHAHLAQVVGEAGVIVRHVAQPRRQLILHVLRQRVARLGLGEGPRRRLVRL